MWFFSFFFMLRRPPRSTLFPYNDALPIFAIQRLMNAMRQAHADGWFIVFDTLTLADDRLEAKTINQPSARSEERFSRNAETDLVCRLLLEKKKNKQKNKQEQQ